MKKYLVEIPISERIQKEQEFYGKDFLMSYSGLSKLAYSPVNFYMHYVLNQREDSYDKTTMEGSLIHCLLLNPEKFEDDFVISAADLPSDNARAVINIIFNHYKELHAHGDPRENLADFNGAILDVLKDVNLYQSLKTDSQRVEKMVIAKNIAYFEYLKKAEGRIIIDDDTYNFCSSVVSKIKSTPYVMDIMGFFADSFSLTEKFNELQLVKFGHSPNFGLRGIIDNLVIDADKKEIRINDLKKTAKTVTSFTDSIEYYRYYLQAAMYKKLVEHVYLSQPKYADYNIVFRFVVVDSLMQIAPIKVTDETMKEWEERLEIEIKKADYHFDNKNFDLPYEFLINNNEIEL
jgi:hypothetical protein